MCPVSAVCLCAPQRHGSDFQQAQRGLYNYMHLPYRRLWTATRYCGGTVRFLHFVLCHAFHQHERHEACPHHEEGACHCRHLRREVSPLHGKACATTAHTGCGGGQRAVQEQIASLRGLRTCPVRETNQVMRARACIVCVTWAVFACLSFSSAPCIGCDARALACVCDMGSPMGGVPIVQLLSSLEPALSSLERQVGMWRDLSLAPSGGESRHFFLSPCRRARPRRGKFREGGRSEPISK